MVKVVLGVVGLKLLSIALAIFRLLRMAAAEGTMGDPEGDAEDGDVGTVVCAAAVTVAAVAVSVALTLEPTLFAAE